MGLWTGIAYHWLHFAMINPVAIGFGLVFVLRGLAFLQVATRTTLISCSCAPARSGSDSGFGGSARDPASGRGRNGSAS